MIVIAMASMSTPEYRAFQKNYTILVDTVKDDLGSICNSLFSKGLISESVRDNTRDRNKSDKEKAEKLIDTVCDKIKHKPGVFQEFLTILTDQFANDALEVLNVAFQKESESEDKQVHELTDCEESKSSIDSNSPSIDNDEFVCPYCKNCTMHQFFTKPGCPKRKPSIESKSLFPYLDTDSLDEDTVIDLEDRLITETIEIRCKFSALTKSLIESFKKRIPLEDIKTAVIGLVSRDEEIRNAATIANIFTTLYFKEYISFFQYDIVEHLVNLYGSSDDKKEFAEYHRNLECYCKRNVFEVPQSIFGNNSRKDRNLIAFKCTDKVLKLHDVRDIQRKVATILGVKSSALRLSSIKKGCVELYFQPINASMAESIFPLSATKQSDLSKLGNLLFPSKEIFSKSPLESEDDTKLK